MKRRLLPLLFALALLLCSCVRIPGQPHRDDPVIPVSAPSFDLASLPAYQGDPFVVLQNNIPAFTEEEKKQTASFEAYAALDALGRCGTAVASIGRDLMPTEKRGSIGQVKPSGWQTVKYDFVDGKYLYNRCHLIGFQLSGENANEKNLITGTRYLNVEGMLPFENMVADFVKETGLHVLYRVTPRFTADELVARGVEMEALSLEDGGETVCFHVYCYNVQPGVVIDYATGLSRAENAPASNNEAQQTFLLNTSSKKIHLSSCDAVKTIAPQNRKEVRDSLENLLAQGYTCCKSCLGS